MYKKNFKNNDTGDVSSKFAPIKDQIGRASCRERV